MNQRQRSLISRPSDSSLESDFSPRMPILYIMSGTLDPQNLTPSIEGNNLEDPDTPPPERNPSPALAAFFDAVRANIATNQAIITELYNAITQIPHEERQGKAYIDELWSKYDTLQSPDHITPFERRHLDEGTKLEIREVEHKIKLLTGVIEREENLRSCGYYDDEAIRKRANASEKANALQRANASEKSNASEKANASESQQT